MSIHPSYKRYIKKYEKNIKVGILNDINIDLLFTISESSLNSAINEFENLHNNKEIIDIILQAKTLGLGKGGEIAIDGYRKYFDSFSDILDKYAEKKIKILGGNAANASIALKNFGVEAYLTTRISSDEDGEWILEKLKNYGLNTKYIKKEFEKESITFGLEIIGKDRVFLHDGHGDRSFNLNRDLLKEDLDAILILGIHKIRQGFKELLNFVENEKRVVIMDGGDFSSLDMNMIKKIFENATVACFNEIELAQISNSECKNHEDITKTAKKLSKEFGNIVCVHMKDGSLCAYEDELTFVPSFKELSIKTKTGLGDCFIAGFVYGFLQENNIKDKIESALSFGNASAICRLETGNYPTMDYIVNRICD